MGNINPQLQKVIDDFAVATFKDGKDSTQYRNLVAAVTASPVLNERLNTAAEKGYLDKLAVNRNPNAGASYNAQEQRISINLSMLQNQDSQKMFIFQLGHEIQHGFFYYEQGGKEMEERTQQEIKKIAESNKAVKNYTPPVSRMLDTDRDDEALAMIAGWNAVVSYEQKRQQKSKLNLKEIVKPEFEYEKYFLDKKSSDKNIIPASGLKFNPDMTIAADQKEILAKTYFDQAPDKARLGPYGDSDYRNSYAGRYISFVVQEHYKNDPSAKLVIDMKGRGLEERQIERNGLDLGAENRRAVYYDKSRPNTPEYFDHTRSGANAFKHVPIVEPTDAEIDRLLETGMSGDTDAFFKASRELADSSPAGRQMLEDYRAAETELQSQRERENRRLSLDNMPERAQELHRQISEKLTAYAREHNLPFTERGLQNSITALTAEAYAGKLENIDHIALTKDNRLAVMQEGMLPRFAETDAGKAALSEPKESFRDMLQAEQQLAQEAEQREQQRQMEQSRGMVMSR